MGTRHLIAVYQGGTHKIAQYGQWDGYPAGQGKEIVEFLADKQKVYSLEHFKLKDCRFLTGAEIERINKEKDPIRARAQLSRNVGSQILNMVARSDGLVLKDDLDFAADGLFCEWAYVIDFDTRKFEVYKGFNKSKKKLKGRFKNMTPEYEEYTPVTLVKTYDLDNPPTVEQLIADCDPPDEPVQLIESRVSAQLQELGK